MPRESDVRDESQVAAALLDEIAALLAEMQPGQDPRPGLDLDLERDLGLDSLARVELVVRLEQRFTARLPAETFAEADTPRDLLRALLDARGAPGAAPVEQAVAEATPTRGLSPPAQAATLPDVLRWHAGHAPDHPHVRVLDRGRVQGALSHRDLLDTAEGLAIGLQARGVEPGARVALMLPTGVDYFTSFFAILLCGAVPVPIYPPARASQIAEHLQRHAGILANSGAVVLVTVARARALAHLLRTRARTLKEVLTPAELRGDRSEFLAPRVDGGDVAFLQYTSGSTGHPKGVVLTHADLLASVRAMGQAIDANASDVFVSWLPLYHDMGLIGAWFGSLYYGIPLVIMPPLDFLAHPRAWLDAIGRYGGTLSASPNFGYELCLKRITDEELAGLDLRRWRAAFNGAEPVSPATLERFAERFAAAGFRAEAAMPVYGLAEATLGVTFPPLGRAPLIDRVDRQALSARGEAVPAADDDASALRFASCGRVLDGYELRIAGDDGSVLPPRRQGRVEFRGPSATRGYFDNPDATARLYHGDWLDSGDLGYLADGELYLTGRSKDLIVRAGRNLYPQEIEDAVGDIDGIRKGCVVAFGSAHPRSGTERVVVLAETRVTDDARRTALTRRIREVATDLIGTPPEVIELVPPHAVLKTSSGKIRRDANRAAFERGGAPADQAPGFARLAIAGLPGLLREAARRAGGHLFAAWAWGMFWLLAPPAWLGVVLLPTPRWRFAWAGALARTLARTTFTPLAVDGRTRLPARGEACVIVANHASYLDGALLVAALPRELTFVAKEALAPQFIAGTFLRRLGTEFVERFDARRGLADLQRIGGLAHSGSALVFFAEGTFSAAPGLRPFHMGAFVTALEAGLPLVPVTIAGSRQVLRSGSWYPHRGRLRVTIGEAVVPPEPSAAPGENWRAALRLRDAVRAQILAHCAEPDLAPRA